MAKKSAKKKKKKSKVPSLFAPPAIDIGNTIAVSIKQTRDAESTYALSDGTKIHARLQINSVERSKEKYTANGEPVYQVQAGIILRTEVAKKLKRKLKK